MVTSHKTILRGEVYWVHLDPTVGTEIKKTRPALVISPNDMNAALPRVIVAPITSRGQALGCRPEVFFNGKMSASSWTNCGVWTSQGWEASLERLMSLFGTM